MFWKIYFLYDFCGAQTCSFRAVFGLPIRVLTISAIKYSVMRKKSIYRCTSTLSALIYCGGIFFKSLSYLDEVDAQTFLPIFC